MSENCSGNCASCANREKEEACALAESLGKIGGEYRLTVSNLGLLTEAIECVSKDPSFLEIASACIAGKNAHDLKAACDESGVSAEGYDALCRLLSANFAPKDAPAFLSTLPDTPAAKEVGRLAALLADSPCADKICFDFSLTGDVNYYNGFIFKGFLRGIASDVLSGGQYDGMMEKLGRTSRAVGFAIYLDLLEALDENDAGADLDVALLYDETCDPREVANTADAIRRAGKSCSALRAIPEKLRYKELKDLRKEGKKC